jgi:hypothetical protein
MYKHLYREWVGESSVLTGTVPTTLGPRCLAGLFGVVQGSSSCRVAAPRSREMLHAAMDEESNDAPPGRGKGRQALGWVLN